MLDELDKIDSAALKSRQECKERRVELNNERSDNNLENQMPTNSPMPHQDSITSHEVEIDGE